ncbi:pentapeptide repeat-containing protein [Desulfogranum japonicum]|uniref:pentapeptide repeat-containing protein n=1 Tax=Desulfogranum japonicum TaxID=231447 RepID=UPI000412ED9A|nr:pentapeptide repeat-containing protein [Desulfogranum japonicum]
MKGIIFCAGYLVLLIVGQAVVLFAADSGSPRAEVQKNFDQLVASKNCPGCDLAGAVLNRLDLRGANLEGANLAGARVQLADLSRANLKNANLQGARLGGTDFAEADLRGANLTGAVLEGAFLATALMDGNIVTRSPDEDDEFSGSGEKVYVPTESASKPLPYTEEIAAEKENSAKKELAASEEVVVGKRMDLASPPPEVQVEREVKAAEQKQAVSVHATRSEAESNAAQKGKIPAISEPSSVAAIDGGSANSAKQITPMADLEISEEIIASQQKKLQIHQQQGKVLPVDVKGAPISSRTDIKASKRKEVIATGVPIEDGLPELEDYKKRKPGQPVPSVTAAPLHKKTGSEPAVTDEPVVTEEPIQAEVGNVTETTREQDVSTRETEGTDEQEEAETVQAEAETPVGDTASPQHVSVQPSTEIESPPIQQSKESKEPLPLDQAAEDNTPSANVNQGMMYSVQTPSEASAEKVDRIEEMLDRKGCVSCDFAGVDLSGKRLKGFDLERANFSGSKLVDTDFREANLKGVDFTGADMREADLRKADLYRADFSGADLTDARLEGALKDSAIFSDVTGLKPEENNGDD